MSSRPKEIEELLDEAVHALKRIAVTLDYIEAKLK